MTPDTLLRELESILDRNFKAIGYTVLQRFGSPGIGAFITLATRGIWVRVTSEYGDYMVDVSTPQHPDEWHHAPELLLLVADRAYTPGSVDVGKTVGDLDTCCGLVARNVDSFEDLLSASRRPDTLRRLEAMGKEIQKPLTDLIGKR